MARRHPVPTPVHTAEEALSLLAGLRRLTVQRGVLGGEGRFLVLGAAVWGLHALRKATERQAGVVWSGQIGRDEQLLVTYRPPTRRRRR